MDGRPKLGAVTKRGAVADSSLNTAGQSASSSQQRARIPPWPVRSSGSPQGQQRSSHPGSMPKPHQAAPAPSDDDPSKKRVPPWPSRSGSSTTSQQSNSSQSKQSVSHPTRDKAQLHSRAQGISTSAMDLNRKRPASQIKVNIVHKQKPEMKNQKSDLHTSVVKNKDVSRQKATDKSISLKQRQQPKPVINLKAQKPVTNMNTPRAKSVTDAQRLSAQSAQSGSSVKAVIRNATSTRTKQGAATSSGPSRVPERIWSFERTIHYLGSSDVNQVLNALVTLRKRYMKQEGCVERMRRAGAIHKLLTIIQKPSQKVLDVAFSLLGNCCMDAKVRSQILSLNGIPAIVTVLKSVEVASIQNRVCRTLANLALDMTCARAIIDQEGAIATIVQLTRTSQDADCLQTYARTLRLLGCHAYHQRLVLEEEGLKAMAELLKHDDASVISAGLKAVAEYTKQVSSEHALQLVSGGAPASLLQLCQQTENREVRQAARKLLLDYISYEPLRPPLGNAGAIAYFLEFIQGEKSVNEKLPMINALCLCCQEVVNRVKIKLAQGLQCMLGILKDDKFHKIHNRIISAFMCFMYDDEGVRFLLASGLVPALLKHLRRIARLPAQPHDWKSSINSWMSADDEEISKEQAKLLSDVDATMAMDSSVLDSSRELDSLAVEVENELLNTTSSDAAADAMEIYDGFDHVEESVQISVEVNPSGQKLECATGQAGTLTVEGLNVQLCSADAAVVTGDAAEAEMDDDDVEAESASDKPRPKYSIDSPSYQAACQASAQEYRYSGPTNLRDAQDYYAVSPDHVFASSPEAYSPLRVGFNNPPFSPSPSTSSAGDEIPHHMPSPTSSVYSPSSFRDFPSPPHTCISPPQSPLLSSAMVSPLGEPAAKYSSWWTPDDSEESELEFSAEEDSCSQYSEEVESKTSKNKRETTNSSVCLETLDVESADCQRNLISDVKAKESLHRTEEANSLAAVTCDQSKKMTQSSAGSVISGDDVREHTRTACSDSHKLQNERPSSHESVISVSLLSMPDLGDLTEGSVLCSSLNQVQAVPENSKPCQEISNVTSPNTTSMLHKNVISKAEPVEVTDLKAKTLDLVVEKSDIPEQKTRLQSAGSSVSTPGSAKRRRYSMGGANTAKKVRTISPEAKEKIRLAVESNKQSRSPRVDVTKLMSPPGTPHEHLDTFREDEHVFSRDPRKITESHLLQILSRVSNMQDPSNQLANLQLCSCLAEYLVLASEPLPRAARILLRLAKSVYCLERLMKDMIPVYIASVLTRQGCELLLKWSEENVNRKTTKNTSAVQETSSENDCDNQAKSCKMEGSTYTVADHKSVDNAPKVSALENTAKCDISEALSVTSTCDIMSETGPDQSAVNKSKKRNEHGDSNLSEAKDDKPLCKATTLTDRKDKSDQGKFKCKGDLELDASKSAEERTKQSSGPGDVICDKASQRITEAERLRDELLETLALMAESHYGRGQLAHQFLSGRSVHVHQQALCIPYMCRSSELRYRLLIEGKGLIRLFDMLVLPDADDELRPLAGRALSHLAVQAGISWPLKSPSRSQLNSMGSKVDLAQSDVYFFVSDGSLVRGHRRTLTERSPVFAAMLEGHFSESNQSRLNLRTVGPDAFRLLIGYLHGYQMSEMEEWIAAAAADSLLEAYGLADQYLVHEFQLHLIHLICQTSLQSSELVGRVCEVCNLPNSALLCENMLSYLIGTQCDMGTRLACWKMLGDPQWYADVQACLLKMFMNKL